MKKLSTLIIAFTLAAGSAYAQQIPLYSNYFYTPFIFNPALSGSQGVTEASLIHRRQWTGMDGSPETSAITLNGALNEKKVGYSIYGYSDRTDILSRNGIYGSYAYHVRLSEKNTLSFGVSGGYVNTQIDLASVRVKDQNDPLLNYNLNTGGKFDLGAGVNLQLSDFQLGFSAPQLLEPTVDFSRGGGDPAAYAFIRHYMINTKYDFRFSGDKMVLSPFVFVRAAEGVDPQIDGGIMFNMREYGFIGGAFRSDFGVVANIGIHLTDQLTMAYAHDFSTNTFSSALGATSEFMLAYRFGSNARQERLENEMKRLKQSQRKQADELDETLNEKLEDLKKELQKENQKKLEEEREKLREQMQEEGTGTTDGQRTGQQPGRTTQQQQQQRTTQQQTRTDRQTTTPGPTRQSGTVTGYPENSYASKVQPGSSGYYVVSGVFGNESNANRHAENLRNQGLEVGVFRDPSNNMHYVFLFKFNSYEDARKAKDSNLNGQYSGKLWIKSMD